jgi:uncharacterized protein
MHFLRLLFTLTLICPVGNSRAQTAAAISGIDLAAAATAQIGVTTIYDPAYVSLKFPGGDVPMERGVCCDVVIRALRRHGVDLQKLVHDDMKLNFSAYPKNWGLKTTDKNIDHRRVPNLMTFFSRKGKSLPVSDDDADYRPGDIVTWMLPGNLHHIGIVADEKVPGTGRPAVIHNIGSGAQREDVLRAFKIIGHYRW